MSAPPARAGAGAARSAARPHGLPAGTVSWLEIDLGAVRDNVRAFAARLAPPSRLVAVVKSDAYGHGMALVAPAALEAGAAWLAAGGLVEGIALRQLVGPAVPILLLNHVPAADAGAAVEHDLRLTLYDADALPALSRAALRLGRTARVHVKIETGTNRQGLPVSRALDLARLAGAIPGLELEGISTHFADIEDTTDHAYAERQLAAFAAAVARFRDEGIEPPLVHAACSAATILFPETHFQLARAGIGIYGLWPSRETLVSARERGISAFRLRAAMTWKCLVAQVKDVAAGSFVGYGRTWRATRPSRIAVLPVGYYEGYARALSGRAHVLLHGQRAPVVGRICMNMCMVDVTDIAQAQAGDVAVLLGGDGEEAIRAEDLATWASTIHYEIVSRIHPSLPRIAV
ncbi:MAG: alanine racemase [Acidobacteria bacterium]|nr:alanine racemase [Acidobacteriota bacterium]